MDWAVWVDCIERRCVDYWHIEPAPVVDPIVVEEPKPIVVEPEPVVEEEPGVVYPDTGMVCSEPFVPDAVISSNCTPEMKDACFELSVDNARRLGLNTTVDCDAYYNCVNELCWKGFLDFAKMKK